MKRRDLSERERDLWGLVTKDVKPARKRKPAPAKAAAEPPANPPPANKAAKPVKRGTTAIAAAPIAPPPKPLLSRAKRPTVRLAPVFGGGDPKADKKAAKRLVPIDETLDLHGMTERSAHTRVLRFILGAQDRGARLVLVVTGKGERKGGEGRGIIRTRFIDWVEAAPLRAVIARVAPAKPKDGGSGAFYVFLKRKSAGVGAPRFSKL
ncbi:MAG: Smr/MutS family protein [Parvularculaceae bacterium]